MAEYIKLLVPIIFIALWLATIVFALQYIKQKEKEATKKYKNLYKQKKSSEVRLGQTEEHFAPLISNWKHDPKNFKFLGAPIDGISFNIDEDEIVFIEIKSGRSKLSENQRKIKEIIEKGNVVFKTFIISNNFCGYTK